MIIYHTPGGRLGNQLFEVAFIEDVIKKKEKVWISRIDELKSGIYLNINHKHLKTGLIYKFIDKILVRFIIRPLVHKFRIFTLIYECKNQGVYKKRTGIFPFIQWIEGYFQGEVFWGSDKKKIQFKQHVIQKADDYLQKIRRKERDIVGIHWRKGDYKNFEVFNELNPSLPLSYFIKSLTQIKKKVSNPYFVIFSDEPSLVARELSLDPKDHEISLNSPLVDLCVMSQCDHLILSNSSLAWWAGYLNEKPSSIVLAPKYWLGWKKKQWFPEGIQPSFAEWIDVQ